MRSRFCARWFYGFFRAVLVRSTFGEAPVCAAGFMLAVLYAFLDGLVVTSQRRIYKMQIRRWCYVIVLLGG